ncbi:hypothetical protein [Ancylobacter vacuolatus]|uniref:Bulb-type lectin domain-containing protein n=1 Tax=Ancylobacter vacuolatus TaxID=223389 RepID=A0ABU0DID9_9HYPH|nr:hypothetical protein [Ancylobacter vacuolatus]MDQ0348159.1 hypothetical protein [Ancylobacter vacuolatus]
MSEDTVTPLWTLTRVSQIDGKNLSLTLDGESTPKVEITPEGKATFNTSMTVVGAVVMEAAVTAGAGLTVNGELKVNGPVLATGTIAAAQGLTGLGAVPIGAILMWSGDPAKLPAGWFLCNGGGWLANGDPIPDLRSQFIVGHDPASTDYKQVHNRGGTSESTLKVENLPKDDALTLKELVVSVPYIDGDNNALSRNVGRDVKVGTNGSSKPFDNRPPWYALAYIIYSGAGAVACADPNMRAVLRNDQFLSAGQGIASPSGRYALTMAAGGTLRLLDMQDKALPKQLWVAKQGESEAFGVEARMQPDSNFVMYDGNRSATFASDTFKKGGVLLRVTDDGKVTIDGADGKSVWSKP